MGVDIDFSNDIYIYKIVIKNYWRIEILRNIVGRNFFQLFFVIFISWKFWQIIITKSLLLSKLKFTRIYQYVRDLHHLTWQKKKIANVHAVRITLLSWKILLANYCANLFAQHVSLHAAPRRFLFRILLPLPQAYKNSQMFNNNSIKN